MTTQITNKQVKIISDINFNEKEITNAKIDIEKNNILNLNIPTKVSELENDNEYITNSVDDLINYPNTTNVNNSIKLATTPIINNLNRKIDFPTILTNSGDTLPVDLSSYQLNDTFLNTTDKKIYTATASSYELNTGSTIRTDNAEAATINYQNGIAEGFSFDYSVYTSYKYSYITRNDLSDDFSWKDNREYRLHFKLTSSGNTDNRYILFSIIKALGVYSSKAVIIQVINSKLYISNMALGASSTEIVSPVLLLDYELSLNKEYYVQIIKNSNGTVETKLSETGYEINVIADDIINPQIEDFGNYSSNNVSLNYGATFRGTNSYLGYGFLGQIYLLDTTGEVLKEASGLIWDNGIDLVNKTEYVDKTNKILYIYENTDLIPIGK